MPQPTLLLSIQDRDIEKQFINNEVVRRFNTQRVSDAEYWVDTVIRIQPNIAIVQVDRFTEADLDRLSGSGLLSCIDIIFISRGEPNRSVDKAMQRGVTLHLRTPIKIEFVNEVLEEIYHYNVQAHDSSEQAVSSNLAQFGLLVGSSPAMRRLYRVVRKAAESRVNVFIVGESGSGKELVANTVHLASTAADKPFVALNCGALSPELIESELFGHIKGAFTGANKDRAGVFEQAEGGTLFLDEVTEMPMDHQVKLLRVLETGEYRPVGSDVTKIANVRIISATNREPAEALRDELIREDLYFRLAHFPIYVPPLRERDSDIVGLAKHFLAYRNTEEKLAKKISNDAIRLIESHTWPGNVRELKHAIERAYILADDTISGEYLIIDNDIAERESSAGVKETLPGGIPLEEVERGVIFKTLAQNNGNKSETADQLGISVKTLYNKLEKYAKSDESVL